MPKHSAIYVGDNTHVIEVADLQDHEGEVQTDAAVEVVSIVDRKTGDAVAGTGAPITLVHVADGLYRGTLPYASEFSAGRLYDAEVTAQGSQGFRAEWTERLIAQVRRA